MKFILLVFIIFFTISCMNSNINEATELVDKSYKLSKYEKHDPSLSLEAINEKVKNLNLYIGSYPPNLRSEAHRDDIYEQWSILLSDAKAHHQRKGDTEQILYILSELYRQGFNIDVFRTIELAIKTIDKCLDLSPDSTLCHRSSFRFYLSIHPNFHYRAEKSLMFLREYYAPNLDEEVERAFINLYLHQQNEKLTLKQINYYLSKFPNSPEGVFLKKLRNFLIAGGKVQSKKH